MSLIVLGVNVRDRGALVANRNHIGGGEISPSTFPLASSPTAVMNIASSASPVGTISA